MYISCPLSKHTQTLLAAFTLHYMADITDDDSALPFSWAVDDALGSDSSSNYGASPPHCFASLVDTAIRSSPDSSLPTSPVHDLVFAIIGDPLPHQDPSFDNLLNQQRSFRVQGIVGEFDLLCYRLGPSGLEDFAKAQAHKGGVASPPTTTVNLQQPRIKIDNKKNPDTERDKQKAPVTWWSRSQRVTRKRHRLPNGDVYTGSMSGNARHGWGEYVWTDGCIYLGEWKRGKPCGNGKFSWPSGATYEGEFKSGHLDGFGTFTESDGGTYEGSWRSDRKHGYGQKHYVNGDFYQGTWKRNLLEGKGRYVWRNGNSYYGEWKNGHICGRGTLIWDDGKRYEGQWESGHPRGQGLFTWPDGSKELLCWVLEQGHILEFTQQHPHQIYMQTFLF